MLISLQNFYALITSSFQVPKLQTLFSLSKIWTLIKKFFSQVMERFFQQLISVFYSLLVNGILGAPYSPPPKKKNDQHLLWKMKHR